MRSRPSREEVARRCNGLPFATEIEQHIDWMRTEEFAPRTMWGRLAILCGFTEFLAIRGVNDLEDLPENLSSFVEQRVWQSMALGRTRNPERLGSEFASELRQFVSCLRNIGSLSPSPDLGPTLTTFLQVGRLKFVQFLQKERALASATIGGYETYVTRFLVQAQNAEVKSWKELSPRLVDDFLVDQGQSTGRRGMRNVCSALRGFLRFLRMEGHELAQRLEDFEMPHAYHQEDLPRFLQASQVQRLLESVDRSTPLGIRDFAILLLLATYGLRAAEVSRITLDDIDWSKEKFCLRSRKNGHNDWFPLSPTVGEAILDYLKVRPRVLYRQVFLTSKAPVHAFPDGAPVTNLAGKYLRAAGVELPWLGAHILRHTAARQLMAKGFSFKTIGDYLGHSAISSTSVYLKVDIEGLREVSLGDGEDLL